MKWPELSDNEVA